MEAKNKMIFGRQKNRILRPQEQIADEVRRYVRVRGKEKKDGGRPMWLDLEAKPLTQVSEAGKRGDEGIAIWHARLSLREAADVLRTYRRAAGEKRKAEVNAKAWALFF